MSCLPIILVGIGGLGIYGYGKTLQKARDTFHWFPKSGVVTRSEVVYDAGISKSSSYFSYTYQVREKEFIGRRVTWGNVGVPGTVLFQSRQSVTVYVNPQNFQEAVLVQGTDRWTWAQLGLSSVIHSLGWLGLILCVRAALDDARDGGSQRT